MPRLLEVLHALAEVHALDALPLGRSADVVVHVVAPIVLGPPVLMQATR